MTSDHDRHAGEPDLVEELIRAAGHRPDPPAGAYRRVLAAATSALQAKRRQRRRRWLLPVALAAAVTGVAVMLRSAPDAVQAEVAHIDRVAGRAQLKAGGRGSWTAATGAVIAGSRVRTDAGGRLGLRLADGTSVRLNEGGEIVLESATRLVLLSGRVYVDTGPPAQPGGPIEVVTRAGTAINHGTQFEVLFRDERYRLRVREGSVSVRSGVMSVEAGAGEEVSLDTGRAVRRARVARDDPDWQWAEAVAPTPAIEGESLTVLLAWVARETGREIRYADPDTHRAAERIILHGKVQDLAPMDVLAAMLATTDLRYRLASDSAILIEPK